MNELNDTQVQELIQSVKHLHYTDKLSLGMLCLDYFVQEVAPRPDFPNAIKADRLIKKFLTEMNPLTDANQP